MLRIDLLFPRRSLKTIQFITSIGAPHWDSTWVHFTAEASFTNMSTMEKITSSKENEYSVLTEPSRQELNIPGPHTIHSHRLFLHRP